ncbi:polycystic kidney disease protein 1-like 2 [Poecilia formosa]|uniref:polycystic kidney disease protein 1-like 2 n=1 Tax=Poecilia formosa TaxID=48698 RepID=UPI000444443D|nr:PREDICTED: polycystic kidney disease protein 1-like 2 [Poecilia formosa]
MCWTVLHMLVLLTLCCQPSVENDVGVAASCPQDQRAFQGSCFELVGQQLPFHRAEDWCEERGGHLAYIKDKETQNFLERHLDPQKDMWLGLAQSGTPKPQFSVNEEGPPLSWLDGSPLTFSKWQSSPQPDAACGFMLRLSGFHWKATKDCNKSMHFICQFEPGRRIACLGHHTTLQCGSGQVLMIDGAVFGRDNIHYCRPGFHTPTFTQDRRSRVNVAASIKAHCEEHQICRISEVMGSFDDLCPEQKSYLTVDYHCKDVITLSVPIVAAVYDDITIKIKWHVQASWENCKLQTGDGHIFHLHGLYGLRSRVEHKYSHPGTFVVALECTDSERNITAQEIITVEEPVAEIGVIRCFAGNVSFYEIDCRALHGGAFHIQIQVKAGTNVAYRIQIDDRLLAGLHAIRGNIPHNVTLSPEAVKQLSPGCHKLTLYASNLVTFPEVSSDLQVCVWEELAGLQASLLRETDDCSGSACITLEVSLDRGEPVLLLISLTGENGTFSETREMSTTRDIFQISHPIQGSVQVKIKAWNAFSCLEVEVLGSHDENSMMDLNSPHDLLIFHKKMRKRNTQVADYTMKIIATPSNSVNQTNATITLSSRDLANPPTTVWWTCSKNCKCEPESKNLIQNIPGHCLPDPLNFYKYTLKFEVRRNDVREKSICITLNPALDESDRVSFTCIDNCSPASQSKDTKVKMKCSSCLNYTWFVEETNVYQDWPKETRDCYNDANQIPLVEKQDCATEYVIKQKYIKEASQRHKNITVVFIYSVGEELLYKTYIIWVAASAYVPDPNSDPETTEANMSTWSPAATPTATSSAATPSAPTPSAATHSAPTSSAATPSASPPATPTTMAALTSPSASTSRPTTEVSESLSCTISPSTGTVLDPFSIICTSAQLCSNCQYCFQAEGKYLLCSKTGEVRVLYLPVGGSSTENKFLITATAKNSSYEVSTTLTAQVLDAAADLCSVDGLDSLVLKAVDKLESEGLLSAVSIGELFNSVAEKLNSKNDGSEKEARQELRQKMLDLMIGLVNESPTQTPEETQVVARGLTSLIQKDDELSLSAQIDAATLFANLSLSVLDMNVSTAEDKDNVIIAASIIVEGVGVILEYSSNKNISDALLAALSIIQSTLLKTMTVNEGPIIIQQPHISLFVNRIKPEILHKESISANLSSQPTFSLPQLPSDMFLSDEPVDVRMLSLDKNPFSWNEKGNISGLIGGLSFTREDGSGIPVENLSEDIEILLPRPAGEQVNTSVLDLGNYSTTAIDVPSADSTLLLKMVPSVDPLPFKLFLGYMDYPTDTNYVAMTEMPLPGSTQEERYTWLLSPTNLKGNAGLHYLVVRPIVGPGVKSINATLSITPITSSCKFWNETLLDWKDSGCRVGVKTTHLVTQCLCNHLTFFGSSFFVTPNLVDPSRTAELFATFAENPVVVCFVGALFVTYLLVVVWARRKDIKDTVKVKGTVLEDNDPMDNYRYLLCVCTGHRIGASTSSQVVVTLLGADGNSKPHHLSDPKKPVFERGAVDLFLLTTPSSLGELQGIRLWHNNSGNHPAWFVGNVLVQDLQTEQKWYFLCNSWLAIDMGDCCLDKLFPVSTEMDLKKFSNLFFMKTAKDFSDGHLWFSVISRPPSSNFTCVQRVSCCFSLLLCTMLTSIMFYGIPTDPSDQVMDSGHFEFTWQQFMVGVQSSLIMFPINILIVSVFRNTRPRESSCCQRKTKTASRRQQKSSVQTTSLQPGTTISSTGSSTLDTIIKDISRILQSLSETTKCNIPSIKSEFGSGKETDINAVLAEVEEFLKQNTKCSNDTQTKTQCQLSAEGIEKKSNKTQHLYRQMCQLEKELSLMDPSSFPSPVSFDKAQKQIQGMKSYLEDQLFTSSHLDLDEPKHEKFVPEHGTSNDDDVLKKKPQRRGFLPWWFIFVGWLLVIGTSFVSGYFTMLYGLKFGKECSISWLVSMIVSFFQSLLFIQPLKVVCLAVFFALVIKRVDEEDFQNVAFERSGRKSGDQNKKQTSQWDYHLYEPPPPADIERMKRNKIMEQKAFALLNEILIYMGFMWMLLLVAYGQRDPNAFLLKQHIKNSFSDDVPDSMTLQDVFTWANTTLLQNLFGEYPGFITDGNSKLVGNARVRQLRVEQNSCQIASLMLGLVPDCEAPYSWEIEDTGSYEAGWNHSVKESASSPWTYQTEAELRSLPVWGRLVLYRGGGFVAELGPDIQNASSTLEYLFHNKWLDKYTRAIFVEFTVYNANVNLFCIVTLLMETSAVGAFQFYSDLQAVRLYPSTGGLYFFVMASEIMYLLFILYYMFKQAKLLKQHRWLYFKNKWNLLELSIILLSWSATAVFIQRTLLGNRDMKFYQTHKDQFASFRETAAADLVLQYLVAFLVLLSTVKLWHLLRLNPKMNLITAALHRAWNDISSFLLIIVITLVAYSVASNVIYGWEISSYKTFLDSLLTIISLQIGIFNYDQVLDSHPVLGGLLFGSCIVFMTFVVLNLFISVILVSLNLEQMHHKPSEEEEIVDLLLNKLCNLFGIRYKSEKDAVEPDGEGSSNLTLNNNRNILTNTSVEDNIYQKSDN